MDFFDKLGKKASEAYKATADKTGKIAKETKMKIKIGDLKSQINDLYEEIGKKVYEKHVREEEISIKDELMEQCTKIDVLSDEIDSLLKQCLELKDKKQCPKCFKEIEKNAQFCPNCGEKQTNEPARETEIIERLENSEVKEENQKEKEIIIEDLKQEIENKPTDEIAHEQYDKEEEKKDAENKEDEESKDNLEKTVEIESNIDVSDKNDED